MRTASTRVVVLVLAGAWTSLVVGLAALGLLLTDGEPACRGPFITGASDSLPPRCPDPAVPGWIVVAWAAGLVVILSTIALVRAVRR